MGWVIWTKLFYFGQADDHIALNMPFIFVFSSLHGQANMHGRFWHACILCSAICQTCLARTKSTLRNLFDKFLIRQTRLLCIIRLAFTARFRLETIQPICHRHALWKILLRNEKKDGLCTLNSQQSSYEMIAALFLSLDTGKQLILVGLFCYETEKGQLTNNYDRH